MWCRWELLICICFASLLPLTKEGKSVILFNFCVSWSLLSRAQTRPGSWVLNVKPCSELSKNKIGPGWLMTGESETKTSQLQMLPCVSCLKPSVHRPPPTPSAFSLLIAAHYRSRAAPTCTITHSHMPALDLLLTQPEAGINVCWHVSCTKT